MSFVKLDKKLLSSTLWITGDPETVVVWVYLLLSASPDGVVDETLPAIAHGCKLTVERVAEIFETLSSPDPYSRTSTHDGRRIVVSREPEFSVTLVNFEKYREKDHTAAARQRRRRAEKRHALRHDVTRDVTVHHGVTPDVTQAEAYTEAEEDLSQSVSAVHVDPHTSPTSDGLTDGLTDFSDKRPAQRVRWIQSRSELELADSLWHAICAEHNDIHPEDITAAIRRLGNWLSKNPDQLIRYAAELEPWLRKKVRQDCERIRHVTGRSPPPPPPSGGDQ